MLPAPEPLLCILLVPANENLFYFAILALQQHCLSGLRRSIWMGEGIYTSYLPNKEFFLITFYCHFKINISKCELQVLRLFRF